MPLRRCFFLALLSTATLFTGRVLGDEPSRKVALLVGINNYQNRNFDDLHFAERDAAALATELKKLDFATVLLTGRAATRQNVERTLDRILDGISKRDLVFMSLSGHGMQVPVKGSSKEDAFFCPYDAIRDDPETLLSLSHLIDDVLALKGGRNLVVVDACRNAPRDETRGIQGRYMTLPEETAVLFSCRAGQQSYENDKAGGGHGLFSYALLEGLRGQAARDNGELTWSGLVHHVEDMMQSYQLQQFLPVDRPQEPVSTGNVSRALLGKLAPRTRPRTDRPAVDDRIVLKARDIRARGLALQEKQEYNTAIEAYGLAIQLDPKYWTAYNDRGLAYMHKKEFDKAIQDLDQAISLNPQFASAYNNRGLAYWGKRQADNAIQDLNQAIALNPRLAMAYHNRALAWKDKREFDKALEDWDQAVKINPKFALAFAERGFAYAGQKEYDKAIEDYDKALSLETNPIWYSSRGWARKARKEYDKAIGDFSKAIELDASLTGAYIGRGDVCRDRKQYSQALTNYNEALHRNPKDARVAGDMAWILATCPERKNRNGTAAVAWAKRACEVTSWKEPEYIDTLAAAYAEAGNFREAIKWERKALSFPKYQNKAGDGARRRLKLYERKQAFRTTS
jgi:tetratricopeptide (TPR) repeat protein